MQNLPKSKLIKIGEASKLLGISIDTLRRWEKRGWIRAIKTPGGTRYYDLSQIKKVNPTLNPGRRPDIFPETLKPQISQLPDLNHYSKEINTVKTTNLIEELIKKDINLEPSYVVKDHHGGYLSSLKNARKQYIVSIVLLAVITAGLLSFGIKNNQSRSFLTNIFKAEPDQVPLSSTLSLNPDLSPVVGLVLAESTPSGRFLEINTDTKVNGQFITSDLRVGNNATIDGSTTFNTVTYSWPNQQGVASTFLQNNGSGALAWAPVPIPPTASTTITGIASFSDSFFSVTSLGAVTVKEGGITTTEIKDGTIANGDLANSKVTITAGTGLSGGGDVSLGSSVTLSSTLGTSVDLTSEVTGVLPIANGGSNKALTLAAGGVLWTDSDSFEVSAAGTSGQVLTSAGTGAPTWTTVSGLGVSWSSLTDPSANLSLAHGTNTTTFASTATTETFFTMTGNSLTSGKALSLTSSATAFTGELASITLSGNNAANTGSLLAINNTGGTSNANTSLYIKHYGDGSGSLAFRIDDVSGDTTPFIVTNAGNVGVGLTTTSAKLHVGGSDGGTTLLTYSGPTITSFATNPQAGINNSINSFSSLNSTDSLEYALSGVNQDNLTTNNTIGVGGLAYATNTSGVKPATYGVYGAANNGSTGTVTKLSALYSFAFQDGAGTASTMAGLYVDSNSRSAGTVTLNAGIYIADQSGVSATATSNYQIYSTGTAASYFAGNIGINDTTPDAYLDIDSTRTTGLDFLITNTGIGTSGSVGQITANSYTSGDIFTLSATALTTGSLAVLTGPSGGTAGVTDAALKITSDVGNIGTSNGLISSTATIDSTADAISGVNLYLSTASSQALGTTVGQTYYGMYNTLTKTGADTTSGTVTSYGSYNTASNTGGDTAATRATYGGYFSATGDTSGTTKAYGISVVASGADTNYGLYSVQSAAASTTTYGLYVDAGTGAGTEYAASFLNGNVGIGTATPSNAHLEVYNSTGDRVIRAANDSRGIELHAEGSGGWPTLKALGTTNSLEFQAGNANDGNYLFTSSGNVGINDSTPDAKLDVDSTSTTGLDFLITNTGIGTSGTVATITANAYTSGDIFSLNGTALTTGSLAVLTGPSGGTAGVTDAALKITSDVGNIGTSNGLISSTAVFDGSAATGVNLYLTSSDAIAAANTDYGIYNSVTNTGAIDSAITKTSYGSYTSVSSTLGAPTTAGTTNVYGQYITTTATHAADFGTVNNYGLYVANGTSSTNGASTKYGIYLESQTGADTNLNYSIYSAGGTNYFAGNVGIGAVTPAEYLQISTAQATANLTSTTGTNYNYISFTNTGGTTYIGNERSTTGALCGSTIGYAFTLCHSGAQAMQFGTTNAVRMTIAAGGNVGIGDTTPDALLDIDSTSTTGLDLLITNTGVGLSGTVATITANSYTSGDIFSISATGLTTGTAMTLSGPSTTGVTDHFVKLTADVGSAASLLNLNPDFSGSAVTGYGIYNTATDATANANTDYGYYGSLALTGDAAKTGVGIYSTVTSSSTTGDTLVGLDLATTVTGILAGATTRDVYGLRSQPTAGAESAAGTTNVYGVYTKATADVAVGGTLTTYGAYIANGGGDAEGTTTNYGLYIEDISGADTNIDVNFTGSPIVRIGDAGVLTFTEAGGNNTLCTLTDATNVGNLSCTGNITGSSSGTVGFWTRTSTTLDPATDNDIVSIPTTNTTGADLAITNTGVYTGTGIVNLTADAATAGTLFALSADGITTGKAIDLTSTSNALDSATLLNVSHSATAATDTTLSADIANLSFSPTYSTAVTTPAISGNVLDISRSSTTNSSFASTLTVTGALVSISDTSTATTGTITHTASVLDLTQNYTSSTGTALYVKSYGGDTGYGFRVDDVSGDTTPFVVENTGEVGIGTTAPATPLDIDTGSNTLGLRLRGTAETTEISDLYVGSNGELIISNTAGADTAQYIDLRPEDNEYGVVIRDGSGVATDPFLNIYMNDAATDYVNLVVNTTNATTGLTINANQNVGVGITTPAAQLDVLAIAASTGINLAGTAPASVAGNGTSAATNTLLVVGTAGGASSGTTGQTGGTGGALSLTGGVGGAVAGASGIGGVGGGVTLAGGAGGNGAATGGAGGAFSITAGAAGTGGNANGGTLTLNSGAVTGTGTSTINLGSANTTNLNIGTAAVADTITIGNNTGATSLALTSGTGSQTFTSNVATGTTTTSGFVFDATAITSGTGMYLTTDSVTTGKLLDIATTGNTWTGNGTTNGLINFASTSTAGTISASSILLNLARSGANANASHTAYGIYSDVTNTGTTNTNIAGYFSATGASTSNTGINVNSISTSAANNRSILLGSLTGGTTLNYHIMAGAITSIDGAANYYLSLGAISGGGATATNGIIDAGNISATGGTNFGIRLGTLTGGSSANSQLSTGAVTAVASATNAQLNLAGVTGTAASSTNYGIKIGNLDSTGTSNNGITIGTLSGATTSTGFAVGTLSSATSNGLTIGALSGTTANTGINVGAISGTGATGTGITVGNISTTGTTNYGLQLGTMTGGTTSNYQISTGALTSATTTTNAQINLGGIVTTGGTNNYGVNIGALSGTGTTNYGINIANSTAQGTTNYGVKIGTISGAASGINYGLYVDTISGASTANYAAIFAGGNVGVGTVTPGAALDVTASLGSTQVTGSQLSHIYNSEANPRWRFDRDLLGSGLAGLSFGPGGNTTIAAGGSAIGYSASQTLSLYTSNSSALTERLKIDGSGTSTFTTVATTGTGHAVTANSISTGTAFRVDTDALTTGNVFEFEQDSRDMLALNDRELTVGGHTDLTTLANIVDTYVYDTTGDADGGRWTDDDRARASSWYNETIDNNQPSCVLDTDDRCGQKPFPKKAIIVATTTKLYIFDAKDNTLWMDFRKGALTTSQMIGQTTNSTLSSVFALNGKVYVGNNGSVGEFFVIDFKTDTAKKYNATDDYQADKVIGSRNSTIAWDTASSSPIADTIVNDVHAQIVNGKTYVAVANDTSVSVIHETDSVVYSYSDVTADDYNNSWIGKNGDLWALNETLAQLERWNNVVADSASELNGTPDNTWDETTSPALANAAPTIQASSPDNLYVQESASTVDGKSPVVYIGTNKGVSIVNTKAGDQTNGSVKYANISYITEELIGDTRFMAPQNGSGSLAASTTISGYDASVKANAFTTFTGSSMVYSSGVRGTGITWPGNGGDYICSGTTGTCADDTDLDLTGSAISVGTWVYFDNAGDSYDGLITKESCSATTNYDLRRVRSGAGGDFTFCIGNGTSSFDVRTNGIITATTGRWYFVVGTFDGTNLKIYVNGNLIATDSTFTGSPNDNATPVTIGIENTASSTTVLEGKIDEPFITAETLTASQIKNMYQVGLRALQNHTASRITGLTAADGYQELAESSDTVRALTLDEGGRYLYAGTNSGSDTGGVSVIGTLSDTLVDVFASTRTRTDDDGTAWNDDDILSISVSGTPSTQYNSDTTPYSRPGLLSIGTAAEIWAQSEDFSIQQFLANSYNPFGVTLNQSNVNVDSVLRVVNQISTRLDELAIGSGSTGVTEPYLAESFRVDSNGSLLSRSLINSTTAMQFQNAAGTTILNIDTTNGNVGIGNSAPGTKLDVTGTGRFSSTLTASSGFTVTTGTVSITASDGSFVDLSAVNGSSTTEGLKLPQATDCTTQTAEGLICWDSDTDALRVGNGATTTAFTASPFVATTGVIDYATATDRLKLTVGEVGDIGLEVLGKANQTAAGIFIDAATNAYAGTSGALDMNVTTLTHDSRGLDLAFTSTAAGATATVSQYGIASTFTSTQAVTATSPTFTYYGNYQTVAKSGADNLTTGGTFNTYGIYGTASNTSTDAGAAGTRSTYGGYFSATGAAGGTTTAIGLYATAASADNNYAAIFEAGNVGIGDTTPDSLLHVSKSSAGANVELRIQNSSTATSANGVNLIMFADGENNTGDVFGRYISKNGGASERNWSFGIDTSNSQAFTINPDSSLTSGAGITILTGGNVGINDASPDALFEVESAGETRAMITSSNGSAGVILNSSHANAGILVYDHSATNDFRISWDAGGDDELVLTSAGNLTIDGECDDVTAGTTCADYAEVYLKDTSDPLEAGDLLAFNTYTGKITKAGNSDSSELVGIYSTSPGTLIGQRRGIHIGIGDGADTDLDPDEVPVALTGRAPLKVSTENGPIQIGDFLTLSSVPGVAMKATHPGPSVGRALENHNGSEIKKIMTFVNVSYADPSNALANMSLDSDGSLIIPNLKVDFLTLGSDVNTTSIKASTISIDASSLTMVGSLASAPVDEEGKVSLADAINSINDSLQSTDYRLQQFEATNSARLAMLEAERAQIAGLSSQVASTSANLANSVNQTSTALSSLQSQIDSLLSSLGGSSESTPSAQLPELTPIDTLFATGSATLANLEVTSEATISGQLLAYGATIQDTFKSLGNTLLGSTTVAGDLIQDGTLSITEGAKINALPILYFQDSPLANGVDFFNGKVVIDKTGLVSIESLALGNQSLGTAIIKAGQTELVINNLSIKPDSKIFLTPTTVLTGNLIVEQLIPGISFKVKLTQPNLSDVNFNWLIIQSKEASN